MKPHTDGLASLRWIIKADLLISVVVIPAAIVGSLLLGINPYVAIVLAVLLTIFIAVLRRLLAVKEK
jgi:hypothetical protein